MYKDPAVAEQLIHARHQAGLKSKGDVLRGDRDVQLAGQGPGGVGRIIENPSALTEFLP